MEDWQYQVEKLLADNERLRKRVKHDIVDEDILRLWRDCCPALQTLWPVHSIKPSWCGVTLREKYDGSGQGRSVVQIRLNGQLGNAVEVPLKLGELMKLLLDKDGWNDGWMQLRKLMDGAAPRIEYADKCAGGAWEANLAALKELYLQENQLTSSVSAEIGALTALTQLHLSGN
jgi:hypothetical protein